MNTFLMGNRIPRTPRTPPDSEEDESKPPRMNLKFNDLSEKERLKMRAAEEGMSPTQYIIKHIVGAEEVHAPSRKSEEAEIAFPDVLAELSSMKSMLENFTMVGRAAPEAADDEPVERMVLMEVSCGAGLEMHEMTDVIGEARSYRIEGALARKATQNSFVARAKGFSMQCEFSESISPGDLLLMTPFREYGSDIVAGNIILAKLTFHEGPTKYTLKEYTGKRLRANNPEYEDVDFGPELKRAEIYAVCRGVIERIFS